MSVTIEDYLNSVLELRRKVPEIIIDGILANEQYIIQLNQAQLMEGKTNESQDVRPYYSQDTYFKKPGAAERYIAWKQRITPNANRNPDAPNLFIDGTFHRTLKLRLEGDNIVVFSDSGITGEINSKFENIFGLTDDNIAEMWNEKVLDYVLTQYANYL